MAEQFQGSMEHFQRKMERFPVETERIYPPLSNLHKHMAGHFLAGTL